MGGFNRLYFDSTCPFCGLEGAFVAEIKLGSLEQFDYRIGDTIDWVGSRRLVSIDPPQLGAVEDFGFAECPNCHGDRWVWVVVRDNKIVKVEPSAGPEPFGQAETGPPLR